MTTEPEYHGYLDTCDAETLEGWAWDATRPDEPIEADIYDGDGLLATIAADRFRPDLLENAVGNGRHGFRYPLADSLRDGRIHTFQVFFAGTRKPLHNSPAHALLIDPMAPTRRSWCDLAMGAARTLFHQGPRGLWTKYRVFLAHREYARNLVTIPDLDLTLAADAGDPSPIRTPVSIVIPAKNVGPDFAFTLERIGTQQGIETVEALVVDSGSTDDTVALAEAHGARVCRVAPEDFDHGLTRNYGAEQATGDYLLLMGGDVIPIGDRWLHDMARVLEQEAEVAAVTCRQVPRADADLLACFVSHRHYRSLDFVRDRITSLPKQFDCLPIMDKRKLCGLDNVCTLYRKSVFDAFRFRKTPFAEDIDLGLRMLKAGHRLAFLSSVGVIHSHRTDALYILRKSHLDAGMLQKLLVPAGEIPTPCHKATFDEGVLAVLALASGVAAAATELRERLAESRHHDRYKEATAHLRDALLRSMADPDSAFPADHILAPVLSALREQARPGPAPAALSEHLAEAYLNVTTLLGEFVLGYVPEEEDFIDTLYKLMADIGGAALARTFSQCSDPRVEEARRVILGDKPLGG